MRRISRILAATVALSLSTSAVTQASQVALSVAMSNPVLKSDQKQTAFLKVGLEGFRMPVTSKRVAVNVALVLDKSGSMNGRKIEEAKQAAIQAIRRLDANDIVSVVVYDSTVEVLVPATKLTDKDSVCKKIAQIQPGGRTALFAGVSKAAAELRKFIDRERVNRIVLLSDGLANIGPSAPSELGSLGASLKKENISVTAMGLGLDYNEDLMVQLAGNSGGNHVFIEDAAQIAAYFTKEFNTVLSVVAQEVAITIEVAKGVRPVRVFGNQAEINGQKVVATLTQLYSQQEKFLVLEVDVPASPEGKSRDIAKVSVAYDNMLTRRPDQLVGKASVNFSSSDQVIAASVNADVLEAGVLLFANERNKAATILRDKGDIKAARRLLIQNADYLKKYAADLGSVQLDTACNLNSIQSRNLDPARWAHSRKAMRLGQYATDTQQVYGALSAGDPGQAAKTQAPQQKSAAPQPASKKATKK
ncbi:MAG: vWA domain-containing protein [Planctomycetales bacterium]|jgi:Ca-activated chloride channel family protein